MKGSGFLPLCVAVVGMLLACSVQAGVVGRGAAPPPANPTLGEPKTAICKYAQAPVLGNFLGRKVPLITMQKLPAGESITLALWSTEEGGKVPMWFEELAKKSKAGDVFEVEYRVAAERKQPVLDRMTEYELKPGEDEPNVFLFEKVKDEKAGTFTVTKFRENAEFTLPMVRVAGKMAPKEDLLKLLQDLKSGKPIEIQFVQGKIKSIKKYEPPKWAKFVKHTTQKVGDKELKAVEVDAYGNTLTLVIAPKDSSTLMGKLRPLKEGAPIIYRSTKDDKDTIWLNTVTIPPKGATIPPETTDEEPADDVKKSDKKDDKKPDKKKTE